MERSCCFTGHRSLPAQKVDGILIRLKDEVDHLIHEGVTDFYSGGALGFDQIAAALILTKRDMGHKVRLIFALPCRDQDAHWTSQQMKLFRDLLSQADEVRYVSEAYDPQCMRRRNMYMVDHAEYCICALLHGHSGTDQTVRYATQKGRQIINVAE